MSPRSAVAQVASQARPGPQCSATSASSASASSKRPRSRRMIPASARLWSSLITSPQRLAARPASRAESSAAVRSPASWPNSARSEARRARWRSGVEDRTTSRSASSKSDSPATPLSRGGPARQFGEPARSGRRPASPCPTTWTDREPSPAARSRPRLLRSEVPLAQPNRQLAGRLVIALGQRSVDGQADVGLLFEHREHVDLAGVDTSPETKAPRLMPADKVVAKRSSVGAGETQDRWQHRIGVRFGLDEAVAGKHAEGVATLDGAQIGERLGEADIDTTRRHRERVEHRECLGTQHAHAAPDRRSHRVFAVTRRTGRAQPDRGRLAAATRMASGMPPVSCTTR